MIYNIKLFEKVFKKATPGLPTQAKIYVNMNLF